MANGPFTRRRLSNEIAQLQLDLVKASPFSTGARVYVQSSDGSNSNDGSSPSKAVATLAYALSLLPEATKLSGAFNPTIIFMANHVETVHTAAWLTISTTGVRIIGLGVGRNRPKLTWDATAAQILVTGVGVSFENCVFDFTGINAVVAGFAVDAADVQFIDCEFICNAAAAGVVSGITVGTTTTSPRFRVENCRFLGPAVNSGTTSTAHITLTDAPDFVLRNNYFAGKATQFITNGSAILRGSIHGNIFQLNTGTKVVNLHASSTALVSGNYIEVPGNGTTSPVIAAGAFMCGNFYNSAAAGSPGAWTPSAY